MTEPNTIWIQVYTPAGHRASITIGFEDGKLPEASVVDKMVAESGYLDKPIRTIPANGTPAVVPPLSAPGADKPPPQAAAPVTQSEPVPNAVGWRDSLANNDGLLIEIGKRESPTYQIVHWANQPIDYDNKDAEQYDAGQFVAYRMSGAIETKSANNGNLFVSIPTEQGTHTFWQKRYESDDATFDWKAFEKGMFEVGYNSESLNVVGFRAFSHGLLIVKVAHGASEDGTREFKNFYGFRNAPAQAPVASAASDVPPEPQKVAAGAESDAIPF